MHRPECRSVSCVASRHGLISAVMLNSLSGSSSCFCPSSAAVTVSVWKVELDPMQHEIVEQPYLVQNMAKNITEARTAHYAGHLKCSATLLPLLSSLGGPSNGS